MKLSVAQLSFDVLHRLQSLCNLNHRQPAYVLPGWSRIGEASIVGIRGEYLILDSMEEDLEQAGRVGIFPAILSDHVELQSKMMRAKYIPEAGKGQPFPCSFMR